MSEHWGLTTGVPQGSVQAKHALVQVLLLASRLLHLFITGKVLAHYGMHIHGRMHSLSRFG